MFHQALKILKMRDEFNTNLCLQETNGGEYTIVRPGAMKNEPATGKIVPKQNLSICGESNREGVASCIVKILSSDKADGKFVLTLLYSSQYV